MSKEIKKAIPELRFPDFQDFGEWNYQFGDKIFEQIADKDHNSDLPVLAITQEHGAIPRDQIDYHVSVTDKSLETYKVVQIGDFIISLRSFQGGIEYSNYKGICSPAYIILRKIENIDDDFFRHYFKTPIFISDLNKNIEGIRDGKMVSFKQFSELSLPYPKVVEQQKIASCLSSLDEIIAANTLKLEALKAHKKGLMQQLFPTEGETVPRLRFPEFVGDGEWEVSTFDKLGKFTGGGTPSRSVERFWQGTIPWISSSDLNEDSITNINVTRFITEEALKESATKWVPANSLLIVSRVGVGKVAVSTAPICTSQDFTNFTPNKSSSVFLGYFLKSRSDFLQSLSQGMAIKGFTKDDISKLVLPLPKLIEQQKIASCLSSLDELITAQSEKIEAMKTHKKGLMQGLFLKLTD